MSACLNPSAPRKGCTMGYSMLTKFDGHELRYTEWVKFPGYPSFAPQWGLRAAVADGVPRGLGRARVQPREPIGRARWRAEGVQTFMSPLSDPRCAWGVPSRTPGRGGGTNTRLYPGLPLPS